jgi:DNA-binding response OmpR family regulator
MHMLIVEDDIPLCDFLREAFEAEHYRVEVSTRGDEALIKMAEMDLDLAILDLNLPGLDGLTLLKRAKIARPSLPVVILTARSDVHERVQCLDHGADDFVAKPFSFLELSARLRALLRRSHLPSQSVLRVGDLRLDRVQRRVERAGKRIDLTSKEFSLLEFLMCNAGRKVTRDMIIEHVWNLNLSTASTNVVDVYINYLRRKIDAGASNRLIHTLRGVGYQIRGDAKPCPQLSY